MDRTAQSPVADGRWLVGQNVRAFRKARGWSQEALAERSGLHWTYVGSVERAERNVSIDNICRLAAALGRTPVDLLAEPVAAWPSKAVIGADESTERKS